MNRQQIVEALWPLVDRCHTGHCWVKGKNGPRAIDEVFDPPKLNEHAAGNTVYGLCPIKPGESVTRVACLDFDSHKGETPWQQMRNVADTVAMCLELDAFMPVMFRSAGGSGIHLYLVWDSPQDAHSVRKMLAGVLGACGLKSGTHGVHRQEVEIFPKQDEVPADGYGSMFILPLSKATKSELLYGEMWISSPDVPFSIRESRIEPNVGAVVPTDLKRLKAALDAIPNSNEQELDYDQWRNVVFGIHHATEGGDEGLALAHEFSARSSKYDGGFLDSRVWPYVRSDREGSTVTDRTIYAQAAKHGWEDPSLLNDFDDVSGGAGPTDPPAQRGTSRFQVKGAAEARKGKKLSWLIKGVIPRTELVVIYGESGSGKTFCITDMAASIARGLPWRGHRVHQARVVYIAAEGASGFGGRIEAYCEHHKATLDAPFFGYIDGAPNLLLKEDLGDLIASLKAYGPIDMLIVDTLARVMPGGNENASEDVGRAIAHCKVIHEITGATVVLVHHSGKDAAKGARGWSGLKAAVDAELEVVRSGDDRAVTVSKLKDGQDGAQFGFKLLTVPVGMDDDGDIVSSCVVEYTDGGGIKPKAKLGANEQAILETLPDVTGPDGTGPQVEELITQAIDRIPFDAGAGKRDKRRENLLRALQSLAGKGFLNLELGRVVPT